MRSACSICELVLSAATDEALKNAHVDHLTRHLEEHLEKQVAAGRATRVQVGGRTLYRLLNPVSETLAVEIGEPEGS